MAILLIGASSLLLALIALCSTGMALFIAWRIGLTRKIDCAMKQTQMVKAIKRKRVSREIREFAMLETDTITYLKSVRVFSKREEPHGDDSLFPQGQFKRIFHPKRQFKRASRLSAFTDERTFRKEL